MTRIELSGIEKQFGKTPALRGIDLAIESGELMTLVGPSGCGKSTLLNIIAGLEDPSAGTVRFGDSDVTAASPKDRDVAFVFQSYALYPHMSVAENIAFPLKMAGVDGGEVETRVRETAELLQIEALLERKPGQLSGGQRQRVALGRAMVRRPAVFLLDEPLSNLDAKLRLETRAEIKRLHHELATTFVYVTHDQTEAMTLSGRLAVMKDGEIQQVGTPDEVYRDPANTFVATFIGSPPMNLLAARRDGANVRIGEVALELPAPMAAALDAAGADDAFVIGVRPEHLQVSAQPRPGFEEARVTLVEPLGAESHLHLSYQGNEIVARVEPDIAITEGDVARFSFSWSSVRLFDPETGSAIRSGKLE